MISRESFTRVERLLLMVSFFSSSAESGSSELIDGDQPIFSPNNYT